MKQSKNLRWNILLPHLQHFMKFVVILGSICCGVVSLVQCRGATPPRQPKSLGKDIRLHLGSLVLRLKCGRILLELGMWTWQVKMVWMDLGFRLYHYYFCEVDGLPVRVHVNKESRHSLMWSRRTLGWEDCGDWTWFPSHIWSYLLLGGGQGFGVGMNVTHCIFVVLQLDNNLLY